MLLSGRPSASQRTVNVDQPAGDGVFREKFGAAAFTGFHLAAEIHVRQHVFQRSGHLPRRLRADIGRGVAGGKLHRYAYG